MAAADWSCRIAIPWEASRIKAPLQSFRKIAKIHPLPRRFMWRLHARLVSLIVMAVSSAIVHARTEAFTQAAAYSGMILLLLVFGPETHTYSMRCRFMTHTPKSSIAHFLSVHSSRTNIVSCKSLITEDQ